MHRLFVVRLFVTLSIALAGYFAPSAQAASAVDNSTVPNRGTLYRVQHDGHTAYLFGTVHVGQASFYPLEPVVLRALAESAKFAVELDIRDQPPLKAAVEKYGMLTPPQTLDQVLAPATLKSLQQALDRLGIPFQAVAKLKPWTVSTVLLALALEKNGFAREQGVEVVLLEQAKALDKPVVSLETADYQIGLFDTLDAAQQEEYLREMLQAIGSGKFKRQAQDIMDAWGRADSAALETLLLQELSEPTVAADFTRRVLLDERNPSMTSAIQHLIDGDSATFVAIGLLHLVGPNSVPKLLQRHGYQVEKLY